MKRYLALLLAALMLLMCGCSLLDREYSTLEPHANRYWEDSSSDIMRAETYQDLVNILMMMVENHETGGVLRLYLTDVDYTTAMELMKRAVSEVREETAIGAYVLSALNYRMEELRNSYYQVSLQPVYRRTAEDVSAIRETASSSAIYDLIVSAWENNIPRLTVRYSYLAEKPEELLANIRFLQLELEGVAMNDPADETDETGEAPAEEPEEPAGEEDDPLAEKAPPAETGEAEDVFPFPEGHTPWEVNFYPPESNSSIVEIILEPYYWQEDMVTAAP